MDLAIEPEETQPADDLLQRSFPPVSSSHHPVNKKMKMKGEEVERNMSRRIYVDNSSREMMFFPSKCLISIVKRRKKRVRRWRSRGSTVSPKSNLDVSSPHIPSVNVVSRKQRMLPQVNFPFVYCCLFLMLNSFFVGECQFSHSNIPSGMKPSIMKTTNVSEIIRSVLDGYDIRLRPGFGGDPMDLDMDVVIASFDSISEVNMDYTLTIYLNQYWRDERLAFAHGDDMELTLAGDFAERIWVPDTFFANDKHSFLHEVTEKNKRVRLTSNGSISYGMRFTTTLACMMDLHYYPLDTQNCTVEIESYGYTTNEVKMGWRGATPVIGVETAELPQFSIVSFETTDRVEHLVTGSYQRLSLSFTLKRNIGYFIFQTYMPSILIVALSWVSFWINHEATSARVALGITTVLTMTTISTGVRSSLPRISYVKAIDIYLVMCFIFVFCALLEYAVVNYTYWGRRAKKKDKSRSSSSTDPNDPYMDPNPFQSEDMIELQDVPVSLHRNTRNWNKQFTGSSATISEAEMRSLPNLFNTTSYNTNYQTTFSQHQPQYHSYSPHHHRRNRSYRMNRQRPDKKVKVFNTLKKGVKLMSIPTIRDINMIDKISRVFFPLSFIIFNIFYWTFYMIY